MINVGTKKQRNKMKNRNNQKNNTIEKEKIQKYFCQTKLISNKKQEKSLRKSKKFKNKRKI